MTSTPGFRFRLICLLAGIFLPAGPICAQPEAFLVDPLPEEEFTDKFASQEGHLTRIELALENYHRQHREFPVDSVDPNRIPVALTTPYTYLRQIPREPYYETPALMRLERNLLLGYFIALPITYLILRLFVYRMPGGKWREFWAFGLAGLVFVLVVLFQNSNYILIIPALLALFLVILRRAGRRLSSTLRFAGSVAIFFLLFVLAVASTELSMQIIELASSRPPYRYQTDGQSYYLISGMGPDRVRDLPIPAAVPVEPGTSEWRNRWEASLLPLRYDPSNGTLSPGDVFLVGP